MNRFLLTLLALLTGFVAQVSPAQAAVRGVGETEIGSVQAARGAVRLAREVAVRGAAESISHGYAGQSEAAPLPQFLVPTTSVRIGIDRARE